MLILRSCHGYTSRRSVPTATIDGILTLVLVRGKGSSPNVYAQMRFTSQILSAKRRRHNRLLGLYREPVAPYRTPPWNALARSSPVLWSPPSEGGIHYPALVSVYPATAGAVGMTTHLVIRSTTRLARPADGDLLHPPRGREPGDAGLVYARFERGIGRASGYVGVRGASVFLRTWC